jgi:uncharacterized RDD family membrane protein YckC
MSSPETPEKIDTWVHIVTPENIAFTYYLGGPYKRLLAWLLDKFLVGMMLLAALFLFGLLGAMLGIPSVGVGTYLILSFLISWLYGPVMERYWRGQTLGKRAMGIRVLTTDGQPINLFQALLRNVLRIVDLWPMGLGTLGLFSCTLTRRFQRLGDLAAGTMVVLSRSDNYFRGMVRFRNPRVLQVAEAIPPGFYAGGTMSRALALYVQRRMSFPPMRRHEIASHLAVPLKQQLGFPENLDHDLFLCGLYHYAFLGEGTEAAPAIGTAARKSSEVLQTSY